MLATLHGRSYRALGLLGVMALLASCRGLRASSVPLGGKHVDEAALAPPAVSARPAPESASAVEVPSAAPRQKTAQLDETPAVAAPSLASVPGNDAKKTGAAFAVKPYVAHQSWTRLFDLEFDIKVGPGGNIDMKMESHQEARFEVLSTGSAGIERLAIEYPVYTSKLTIMGQAQDSPEELAGKRFVVSFSAGKPDVRDASGGAPPKKQSDSVKDDAREPLEIEKALRELAQLAPQGKGDFSHAGAIALAGGEDEDTKVPRATASLDRITSGSHGEKVALLGLAYTLTNDVDEKTTIEVQVAGTLSVLDGPARYQSSTLQGPMELRSSDPGEMQGRGTIKVTTSYRY